MKRLTPITDNLTAVIVGLKKKEAKYKRMHTVLIPFKFRNKQKNKHRSHENEICQHSYFKMYKNLKVSC